MKKFAIILLVLQLFLVLKIDIVGAAAWSPPQSTVQNHQLTFLRVRDEYQLMYALGGLPAGTYQVRANFWSSTDVYYSTVFDNPTKVAYLTCNGTYIFEMLDSSGTTIAETRQINTTKIQNPPCQSYENGQLKNDIGLTAGSDSQGKVVLNWGAVNGASGYDIYKDGEKIGSTTDTNYEISGDGSYTVVAVDPNGDLISSGDYIKPDDLTGGSSGGGSSGGSCDACKWLTDLLACPAWDDYMGELTQAIKNALPPPTDWDEVASIFVDHFADYFGDVPSVPTKGEIQQNIPTPPLDTSVPDADIQPMVPSDYNNGPLDTDITSGEVIPIIDESEPIDILEPDAFIDADPVGEMVFPNDPRNSSDGIKNPDTIDSGYNEPTPQPQPSSDIPEIEMPEPTDIPLPTSDTSIIPTPQPNDDWIIPVPEGGRTE